MREVQREQRVGRRQRMRLATRREAIVHAPKPVEVIDTADWASELLDK